MEKSETEAEMQSRIYNDKLINLYNDFEKDYWAKRAEDKDFFQSDSRGKKKKKFKQWTVEWCAKRCASKNEGLSAEEMMKILKEMSLTGEKRKADKRKATAEKKEKMKRGKKEEKLDFAKFFFLI